MNRFYLAALILFGGASAHAQTLNTGAYETREDAIDAVDALEVTGTFRVSIITGKDTPRVRFQGPPEIFADAMATIEHDVLKIAFKDGKPWSSNPGSRMSALVWMPRVRSVKTIGPARIDVMRNEADEFFASTDGAGRINVERLEAKRVNAAIGGAGSIHIEGTAEEARFAIGGAGSIEAKRLRVARADIATGGPGSVYADVSQTANIAKAGAGRIEIVGGAACTVSPPDARGVECR